HTRLPLPPFFYNAPATTEIYTLSLHDALPIFHTGERGPRLAHRRRYRPSRQPDLRRRRRPDGDHAGTDPPTGWCGPGDAVRHQPDRKSTRLNSSHVAISYAVFCLKKKKMQDRT